MAMVEEMVDDMIMIVYEIYSNGCFSKSETKGQFFIEECELYCKVTKANKRVNS